MTRLLDINVLLALAWPQHIHHARVNRWLLSHRGTLSIATCPLTELGFIRVSMNVRGYAADFESASKLLGHLVNRSEFSHSFWPDDQSILDFCQSLETSPGPNQLTDVYLVNLARCRQGLFATLDAGIQSQVVELIPD